MNDLPLQFAGDVVRRERTREPRVRDLDSLEPPPLEHGSETPANRLDLGQLGHGATVATRWQLRERSSISSLRDDLEQDVTLIRRFGADLVRRENGFGRPRRRL